MTDDDDVQHVTIGLELPGGPGGNAVVMHTVLTLLDHLERDGIRPYRTTVEIADRPTA
ncbi:MAG TPA: hypothetical protein VFO65_03325 [Acidimicrobiales bacterium]|nr:hypothetical protein [Acidimicrobiales bacterium]